MLMCKNTFANGMGFKWDKVCVNVSSYTALLFYLEDGAAHSSRSFEPICQNYTVSHSTTRNYSLTTLETSNLTTSSQARGLFPVR
jgi:hypothetical protein